MSRWRLLTGTSTGSQTVPPEWWRYGDGVGQLHEVAEVLDRAVAPAVVEVADERRAVVRGEDRVRPADLDVAFAGSARTGCTRAARSPGRSAGTSRAGTGRGRRRRPRRPSASSRSASGSPRNSTPTSSRIVSALCSISGEALLAEDLERGELPGQERDVLGVGVRAGAPGARRGRRCVAAAGRPSAVLPRCRSRRSAGVVARRGRRPPAAPPSRFGRAASTTAPRCGNGAVLCGNAIASTKCCWKRGSTAVSIFSTRRTTPSISVRAAPDSSAMSAPVPGGIAGRPDVGRGRSRGSGRGSSRGSGRSGSRTRRPAGSRRPRRSPSWSISRRTPAYSAALASWIARTSFWVMAIRGGPGSVAGVEDVAERPAVGHDPRRPRRQLAVDDAVLGDDPGQEHLGDDLDDPRAADPGDAGLGDRRREGRARRTRRRRR